MGRTEELKAARRAKRATVAVKQAQRRHASRWLGGLTVLVLVVSLGLPAAYQGTNQNWRWLTGTTKQEQNMQKVNFTITTEKGVIGLEMYPDKAPKTVAQIKGLIEKGFYNGLTFHRVEPNFVVQGGDPKGDGTGGSGTNIPFEQNDLKHDKGVLAMARSQDRNSADSQFYITLDAAHFLDGNYVVYGKVISGLEVVEQIAVGDKMTEVKIQP